MSDHGLNEDRSPRRPVAWVGALVLLGSMVCATRLFVLIDAYSVNVLYWDQWDFFTPFFDDASAWEVFRWQHGPHRQGLAFLLTRWVADLSAWNTRADAFTIGAILLLSTGGALWLRRRLFGQPSAADVFIALLILTPAQYGIFVHTPNASHGAGPQLLLIAYCFCWTLRTPAARYAGVGTLNFLLIHTGFGVFIGLVTPTLLVVECVPRWREGGAREIALPLTWCAVSLLSAALFFTHYTFDAAVDGFEFPAPNWPLYPRYMALMFANVLGVKGKGVVPSIVGFIALFSFFVVSFHSLRVLLVTPTNDASRGRKLASVTLSLTAFSLIFCANTAIGRISLGLHPAQATRYVPLVVPAFLGLYLQLQALERARLRRVLQVFFVLAMIAASYPMRHDEARFMHSLARAKRVWVATYLETGDYQEANRASGIRIYHMSPDATRLQEKLDQLRDQGLNFQRDARTVNADD